MGAWTPRSSINFSYKIQMRSQELLHHLSTVPYLQSIFRALQASIKPLLARFWCLWREAGESQACNQHKLPFAFSYTSPSVNPPKKPNLSAIKKAACTSVHKINQDRVTCKWAKVRSCVSIPEVLRTHLPEAVCTGGCQASAEGKRRLEQLRERLRMRLHNLNQQQSARVRKAGKWRKQKILCEDCSTTGLSLLLSQKAA